MGCDPPPSHADDIQILWTTYCVNCHTDPDGPDGPQQALGNLSLDVDAFFNLVGRDSSQSSLKRVSVDPDDPLALSYLWHKISGTQLCVEGGETDGMPVPAPLCEAEIALIERWICCGALP